MKMYLVTASDYDYTLIDSAWLTLEEAESRIAQAQSLAPDDEGYFPYAHSFEVTKLTVGAVRGEMERYHL